ncbi:MAG: hypothetical protein IJM98_08770 [Oscillospiraceae bacterium]|nr:hypothetical protein [Oscillospiraceae bacterium]
MDSINQEIATLFEYNRSCFDNKPIAFDGVVDEESFNKSQIKTIFLLKEVNYPDMDTDWTDFMESIREQAFSASIYKTWPNVCLWMEAMKNENTNYMDCMDENGYFDTKKLQKNLLDIGIVNIKKTAGGGSSKYEEIAYAANKCKDIIKAEIEDIIKPQLVICGGTFDFAKTIFEIKNEDIKIFPSGAEYFIHRGIIYLRFAHPIWYSVNRNILYAYAKTVFPDVKKLL